MFQAPTTTTAPVATTAGAAMPPIDGAWNAMATAIPAAQKSVSRMLLRLCSANGLQDRNAHSSRTPPRIASSPEQPHRPGGLEGLERLGHGSIPPQVLADRGLREVGQRSEPGQEQSRAARARSERPAAGRRRGGPSRPDSAPGTGRGTAAASPRRFSFFFFLAASAAHRSRRARAPMVAPRRRAPRADGPRSRQPIDRAM